jgi:Zn-dependent oligopeptidase
MSHLRVPAGCHGCWQVKAAKNFRAGTTMLRQLQFAVTDLTLHSSFDPAGQLSIHDTFRTVAQRYQAPTHPLRC